MHPSLHSLIRPSRTNSDIKPALATPHLLGTLSKTGRKPGKRAMYNTMTRVLSWSHMAKNIYVTGTDCCKCTLIRAILKKK